MAVSNNILRDRGNPRLAAGVKHYGYVIDILGKAGWIKKAYEVVTKMSVKPNAIIRGAMLGAYRVCMDTNMDMCECRIQHIQSCYICLPWKERPWSIYLDGEQKQGMSIHKCV